MVEKITVNPESIRAYGNVMMSKSASDYDTYLSTVTETTDTVYGATQNVMTLTPRIYRIAFSQDTYTDTGSGVTISCTLTLNGVAVNGATVTFTGSDSSSYTGTTNSSGVATATITGLTSDATFTCSSNGASDTCIVEASTLIVTTLTSYQINDDLMGPVVDWFVMLKDENNTALASKSIKLYIDDVYKTTATTNPNGIADLRSSTTFGTHTIKAVFEGDDTYRSSEVSRTATYEDSFAPIDL